MSRILLGLLLAASAEREVNHEHLWSDIAKCGDWRTPYPNKFPDCEMRTCRKACLMCPSDSVWSEARGKCC